MKRKILSAFAVGIMCLSLASCNSTDNMSETDLAATDGNTIYYDTIDWVDDPTIGIVQTGCYKRVAIYALDGLDMTVPVGAINGFIGENGSGKSTTEKLLCGHLVPDSGKMKLFGKSYKDAGVRYRVGALIENAGCFPNSSVY